MPWWINFAERTREDEQKVAETRERLERVLTQLETATRQLREVLDDDDAMGWEGTESGGPGPDRGPDRSDN